MPSLHVLLNRRLRAVARRLRRIVVSAGRVLNPTRAGALVRRMERLSSSGDHSSALALAEAHLEDLSRSRTFLREARAVAARGGAISLQRRAAALELERGSNPRLLRLARELEGRWLETSPEWSPTVEASLAAALSRVRPVEGRVLHVVKVTLPYRQSGYSVRTRYSLTALAAAGWEPIAVTPLDFPENVDEVPAEEWVDDVRHLRLRRPVVPPHEPFDEYLDAWATALANAAAESRPELIHVHSGRRGYETALVALAVGELLGVPVVYEVRGFFESLWTSDVRWAEQSEIFRRRRDTETRCMQRAAAVVTLSESMRAELVARGVREEHVHVVPNGVDADTFAPRPRSSALAARWGLAGRFVFGYVSNLDHFREGQELLIEAALRLRRRGVPATALIVGEGRRRGQLERLAQDVGVEDAVVFTGRVPHEEVLDYYALCDVFVVPRVDERAARLVTPLKPLEAMALGIPLLVSDLPALVEIIGGGVRGTSFRTGDLDSLTAELEAIYQDPSRARALADEARNWVRTERSWARNGQRYGEIYRSVLARGH